MTISMTDQLINIAKEIMSSSPGKAMHVDEITEKAIALNKNLGLSPEVFKEKLSGALNSNTKSKTKAIFLKQRNPKGGFKRGYYKLKRGAAAPTIKVNKIKIPSVPTLFSGAAGELAVASQLLFWGFNVARPKVDNGIDLWAEKRKHVQYIQVKTCAEKEGALSFAFKIKKESYDSTRAYEPVYIFVMRSGVTINYALIPYTQLNTWVRLNVVTVGKEWISLTIDRDEKGTVYKLNEQNINHFINDFGLIEPVEMPFLG